MYSMFASLFTSSQKVKTFKTENILIIFHRKKTQSQSWSVSRIRKKPKRIWGKLTSFYLGKKLTLCVILSRQYIQRESYNKYQLIERENWTYFRTFRLWTGFVRQHICYEKLWNNNWAYKKVAYQATTIPRKVFCCCCYVAQWS